MLDSTLSLGVIAAVEGASWATRGAAGAPAAPWLLASVAVSVMAGLVQRKGLRVHAHLNHNDLYHLGQLVAVWLLYRGALRLAGA